MYDAQKVNKDGVFSRQQRRSNIFRNKNVNFSKITTLDFHQMIDIDFALDWLSFANFQKIWNTLFYVLLYIFCLCLKTILWLTCTISFPELAVFITVKQSRKTNLQRNGSLLICLYLVNFVEVVKLPWQITSNIKVSDPKLSISNTCYNVYIWLYAWHETG